ncbi:TAFII55 protein conserved region domain-containing protein [Ditylenchus destructor]|uniref:TAFII55 protein conserved region domain-containing protein n=1 Tax=Ditylenchus destructor TaxID=166010 RepID=A0AAD4RDT2_9BILA|nr:TAFII55 protein conserved region domain-containing protein [Ditylenchus destructor]
MSANIATSKMFPKKVQRTDVSEEDWESHLIIRFPEEIAGTVSDFVKEDAHAGERMNIQFEPDARHGTLRFDQTAMPFKVYDLPCVTEVMKTLDKKTLYKCGDLSQMIVCSTQNDPSTSKPRRQSESSTTDASAKKEIYQWPHGLTAPMKNVRKHRFRKTKKKRYMDAPDVERELKRLLRSDLEAHSVRWEVVPVEGEKPKDGAPSMDSNRTFKNAGSVQDNRIPGLGDTSDSDEDSNF